MIERKLLFSCLLYAALSGCSSLDVPTADASATPSEPAESPRQAQARTPETTATATDTVDSSENLATQREVAAETATTNRVNRPTPLQIEQPGQTGVVQNPALDEISGLAVSRQTPGVLFALNDSGNAAELYAMSETGADLGHWSVNARNRDWEDMATTRIGDTNYLVLGDTGDNRQVRKQSVLYLVEEPSLDTPPSSVLEPVRTLRFRYEDGPRNVEAMAINENTVYLISKEAITGAGAQLSRLYTLQLPEHATDELLVARFAGELPRAQAGLEARFAAAVAGVDLNHPTALDFDSAGNTAYLLTYRHVIRIRRQAGQSWVDALTAPATRIHSHSLWQAEALAVSAGQSIWLTSENVAAPIWALPISPPS